MLSMQMIASRELSAQPGKVWTKVAKEGSVVVTRDGQPVGIIVPTSAATLLEDVQEVAFARARRAVNRLRTSTTRNETVRLSMKDIDAEIRQARRSRA
jgi:antitoxin (DNA-binding transcriptional repressor) of toxin-antitoxin stability system